MSPRRNRNETKRFSKKRDARRWSESSCAACRFRYRARAEKKESLIKLSMGIYCQITFFDSRPESDFSTRLCASALPGRGGLERTVIEQSLPEECLEDGGVMKRGFFSEQEQNRLPQSCWLLLLAFLLAITAGVFGQAYFGTITGVLTDPTGAVIPGAKVTLTDQEKGYAFNATSDGGRPLSLSLHPAGRLFGYRGEAGLRENRCAPACAWT